MTSSTDAAAPEDGSAAEQPPARPARRQSVPGIVLTLLVIGGVVLGLVALVPRPSGLPQPAVDVGSVAAGMSSELGFTPSVPAGLPAGWTPTGAQVQSGVDGTPTWRVNYATPSGGWVSLIQGHRPTKKWEGVQIIDGGEQGTVDVAGRTWLVRARPDRQLTAYVLRGPETTTMVAGRAPASELRALAEAAGQLPS